MMSLKKRKPMEIMGFVLLRNKRKKFVETLVSGWCNGTTRIMTVGLNF